MKKIAIPLYKISFPHILYIPKIQELLKKENLERIRLSGVRIGYRIVLIDGSHRLFAHLLKKRGVNEWNPNIIDKYEPEDNNQISRSDTYEVEILQELPIDLMDSYEQIQTNNLRTLADPLYYVDSSWGWDSIMKCKSHETEFCVGNIYLTYNMSNLVKQRELF